MGVIRNCLVALSDTEATMIGLLQYRFPEATRPGGLAVIPRQPALAALSDLEGDFEEGVRRINRVRRGQRPGTAPRP